MKKLAFIVGMLLLCFVSYSQTYKSSFATVGKQDYETDIKDRVITISDKEISISNFIAGSKTQYLIVNKIENKDWGVLDGIQKTYYCTTKDKDPINGYQKAIVYKTYKEVVLALFANEITVFTYNFDIR